MSKPELIVLEGLDGSGKSTQFEKLSKDYFSKKGIDCKPISFPDYEQPSSVPVKMYLNGEIGKSAEDVNAYAASSFYAVDRYISFKKFWEKDYNEGKVILAARYVTSNCIYQMTKLPENQWDDFIKWLEDYEYNKLGLPKPEKVIFLDMPIEISQRLLSERYGGNEDKKDIHEKNLQYLKKCRKAALYCAEKNGWDIVVCGENGSPKTVDEIFTEIVKLIEDN